MEVESILSTSDKSILSTSEGSAFNFHCSSEDLISNLSVVSVCTSEGRWNHGSTYLVDKLCPAVQPHHEGILDEFYRNYIHYCVYVQGIILEHFRSALFFLPCAHPFPSSQYTWSPPRCTAHQVCHEIASKD